MSPLESAVNDLGVPVSAVPPTLAVPLCEAVDVSERKTFSPGCGVPSAPVTASVSLTCWPAVSFPLCAIGEAENVYSISYS
jgi:hypothetical protein